MTTVFSYVLFVVVTLIVASATGKARGSERFIAYTIGGFVVGVFAWLAWGVEQGIILGVLQWCWSYLFNLPKERNRDRDDR